MKKKLRPKGCRRTVSGRHTPTQRMLNYYTVEVYCSACGLIDDVGDMSEYLFGKPKKIDDRKLDSPPHPKKEEEVGG